MSSSIDERIVSMKFDNKQFESGAKTSMDTLDKLKSSLKLDGATKGLQEVDDAAKKLSLKGIADGVDNISSKFSAMSVVAITVLSNIASKALAVGADLAKKLTVEPLLDGMHEYETNLNSIQTILSNTSTKGTTLDQVNSALQELNTYSDKTIYNFAEMARNVGTFTAAGVDLDTSVGAIKGIANLAAISGSSSEQAATGMYQLSQAISSGTVKLMDWNSVQNAGMGGQVFQDSLKETARVHGIAVDELIKKNGSFRDSLQEGWLTADILTETLSKFTGDLSAEQLKSMGYTDEQTQGILAMGKTAVGAAQDVKTFTQLLGTLKEAVGSGWATSWQIVAGDFGEAKSLWTGVSNTLGAMISASATARNKILQDWKDAGGRDALIASVKNTFDALIKIVAPIKEAFAEIFPPATGARLADITKMIEKFTAALTPSVETVANLKSTFKGAFAVIDTVRLILEELAITFKLVFDKVTDGNGSLLAFTAKIGDWLVKMHDAIEQSDKFAQFFINLADWIAAPINYLKEFAHWVVEAFGKIDFGGMDTLSTGLEKVGDRLSPLATMLQGVRTLLGWVGDAAKALWNYMQPLRDGIRNFFGDLGDAIAKSISTMDFNGLLDLVNTGLFGGLLLLVKKFMDKSDEMKGESFFGKIKEVLDGVTGTLKQMQQVLKAAVLLEIAAALGILTASIVALSLIDSAKLAKALGAITIMMVQLAAMFAIVDKIGSTGGAVKMGVLGVSLGILAGAILLLSASVKVFSTMSWEDLAKGFTSITVTLGLVVGLAKLLEGNDAAMVRAGASLILLSTGLVILSTSVKMFSDMSWTDLAKGMAAVTASLLIMVGFVALLGDNAGALAGSAALVVVSGALEVLRDVVQRFSDMKWGEIFKGLTAMAAALAIVAVTLTLMDASLPGAASLVIAAGSLLVMAYAMEIMGNMSWNGIAKAVVLMTVSLTLLAAAMYVMEAGLPGAAALIVIAAGLAILTPALVAMGKMSWGDILRSLTMLAGALTVLGVASIALIPALIPMAALAVILVVLGAGILLAGAGILALSIGLTAIGVGGTAAAVGIKAIADVLLGLIPDAIAALSNGIVEAAGILANSGPVFVEAMTTLIIALAMAIDESSPVVLQTLANLTNRLLDTLKANMPGFVNKGADIIVSMLNGLAKRMPDITAAGGNLIVAFINGVSAQNARIVESAGQAALNFVNGVANWIRSNTVQINAAGKNIASAIIDGMIAGLTGGISGVATAAKNVAQSALNSAKKLLGIASPSKEFTKIGLWSTEGMAGGFDKGTAMVVTSAENMAQSALDTVTKSLSNIGDVLTANDLNLTPTIRPVLDLTDIQKGSAVIDGLLTPTPISPVTSYAAASNIATEQRAATQATGTDDSTSVPGTTVTYNQYNSSPKALSDAEIYRQTRNQLSTIKGGLPG